MARCGHLSVLQHELVGAKATASTGKVVATEATSANAQAALRAKLSGLQKAQETAAVTKTLPDGRIRYYTQEVPARTEGPTRGASFATEFDPKTGNTRQWTESYDKSGAVIRVHPKSINGQSVDAQHYPPNRSRAKELGAAMSMGNVVADRLERVVADGFDVFKISKEALDIYQDPEISLTKDLDMALLSLMAMSEGPEFEMAEKELHDFLSVIRQM